MDEKTQNEIMNYLEVAARMNLPIKETEFVGRLWMIEDCGFEATVKRALKRTPDANVIWVNPAVQVSVVCGVEVRQDQYVNDGYFYIGRTG